MIGQGSAEVLLRCSGRKNLRTMSSAGRHIKALTNRDSLRQQVDHLAVMLKVFCMLVGLFAVVMAGALILSSHNNALVTFEDPGYIPGSIDGAGATVDLEDVKDRVDQLREALQTAATEDDDTEAESSEETDRSVSILTVLDSANDFRSIATLGGFSLSKNGLIELQIAVDSIESQGYDVGFIMVDIITGKGISYNVDELFYGASAIKAPYVASLAAQWPSEVETWQFEMEYAVRYSSNDDYDLLREVFGTEPLYSWCDDVGIETYRIEEFYPYLTTRELAKLWLQNYLYFTGDDPNSVLVQSFFDSSWNSVIYECLGSQYYVNTKSGWINDDEDWLYAANDAGIVWANGRPYLVVIMSDYPEDVWVLEPLVWAIDGVHNEML